MAQPDQCGVEIRKPVAFPRGDGVFLEELEAVVEPHLLSGIDERLPVGQRKGQQRHHACRVAHALEFRPGPRVFVVVRGEHQAERLARHGSGIPGDVGTQVCGAFPSLCDVVQQVVQLPRIRGVERPVVQCGGFALGEQVDAGVLLPQCGQRLLPEVDGYLARHVAAESVDAAVEPETHGGRHCCTHVRVAVVELGDVRPVVLHDGVAQRVTYIPVGRALLDPAGIGRGVVGHPVQDYAQPESVGFGQEPVEILQRAEFGVDGFVAGDGVVRAEGSLALLDADGVDGHQPDDVHAQFSEPGQVACGRRQRPFGGVLAHVHFVDDRVVTPVGVGGRLLRPVAAGNQYHCEK